MTGYWRGWRVEIRSGHCAWILPLKARHWRVVSFQPESIIGNDLKSDKKSYMDIVERKCIIFPLIFKKYYTIYLERHVRKMCSTWQFLLYFYFYLYYSYMCEYSCALATACKVYEITIASLYKRMSKLSNGTQFTLFIVVYFNSFYSSDIKNQYSCNFGTHSFVSDTVNTRIFKC